MCESLNQHLLPSCNDFGPLSWHSSKSGLFSSTIISWLLLEFSANTDLDDFALDLGGESRLSGESAVELMTAEILSWTGSFSSFFLFLFLLTDFCMSFNILRMWTSSFGL